MQSFPQCIVWMRIHKNWVRCIPCARFLYAEKLLSSLKPDVRLLYDMNSGENAYKRRAFIVRSHRVPPDQLTQWIQEELQNLPSHRKRRRRHAYTSALTATDHRRCPRLRAERLHKRQNVYRTHFHTGNPPLPRSDV